VEAANLHEWQVTPARAIAIQKELSGHVLREGMLDDVRFVAGVDISVPRFGKIARGAIVVLNYPELELVEIQIAEQEIDFPYIPGLLSFREAPVIFSACEKLSTTPDLVLVDGQGIAHPRRLGIASHLGLLWDKPTIGCAKSRLCGEHAPVGTERGDSAKLVDGNETIGAVLRTRANIKPLFISTGHRINLKAAVQWVLNCGCGYRLPEPTRLAHQAAGGQLKAEK